MIRKVVHPLIAMGIGLKRYSFDCCRFIEAAYYKLYLTSRIEILNLALIVFVLVPSWASL